MTMNCRGCGTSQERCKGDCCPPCHTNKTLHHRWGRRATPPAESMTSERLAGLRRLTEHCEYHDDGNDVVACTCAEPLNSRPLLVELLDHVDELTTQRDDARRIAVASGVFQDHRGEDYDLDSDTAGTEWRADPVGPVAWDKQEQQR